MTFGMVVRLPVTGAFGTDEEFDLRTRLEREFDAALLAESAGECGLGETAAGCTRIYLEAITDAGVAFPIVKGVLGRHDLLGCATVVLETPDEGDADNIDRQVLWPLQPAPVRVA